MYPSNFLFVLAIGLLGARAATVLPPPIVSSPPHFDSVSLETFHCSNLDTFVNSIGVYVHELNRLTTPQVTLCTGTNYLGACLPLIINTTYDESRPSTANIVNVQGVACYNIPHKFKGNVSSFSVTNGTACFLNQCVVPSNALNSRP
jgi:hypothetical protein